MMVHGCSLCFENESARIDEDLELELHFDKNYVIVYCVWRSNVCGRSGLRH